MSISYCFYTSPIGNLLLLAKNDALIGLEFEQEQTSRQDYSLEPNWLLDDKSPCVNRSKIGIKSLF